MKWSESYAHCENKPKTGSCMINSKGIHTDHCSWQNDDFVASRGAVNLRVCDIDRLGQIQPSGLWCEELVHHAARPLITRITHIEGIPEESRGDLVECYSSLAYLKENES